MAKVTGSYESVVRGVSEQVPQDRRSGQCFEQVNMISDPVRGNSRRHGSRFLDELPLAGTAHADALAATAYSKTTPFAVNGNKYDLIYRTTAATGTASFAWCFDRDAEQFIPIQYAPEDALLAALVAGGVSASVNVGRYIYLAGNTVAPEYMATDTFGAIGNQSKVAIWVRGGAYSRQFKVKVTKVDGTKLEASYKTVSSSYPTLLDTSDILTDDPNYQKKVNDRVYAYNSAVTQWIGTASADITPANIATKLAAELVTLGIANVGVVEGTVTINDPTIKEITGDDGGDGSLIRAVGNELTAAELVSAIHYVGKIVKIRPQRSKGDDAFYVKAYAKNDGDTGFAEVSWRESAGYEMQPTEVFAMGTVVDGILYLAGNPSALELISGIDTPDFPANTVGDALTCILPSFFGKTITHMGIFQDRLQIDCGATVFMSRPGDYFNFFRQSVLTVMDTDPWEGFALGSEDDTIRYSTTYDRDLILFGDRFQYTISGRQVLSPKTASIVVVSSYEDTTVAAPRAAGNFIFYSKYSGEAGEAKRATMHQVQSGQIAESPESFEISQALDGYLEGKPVEITALRDPHMVFLRTDANRHTLYLYSYLDSANASERLTDSWGRWTWAPKVGSIVGFTDDNGTLLVYLLRENAGVTYIACERFTRFTRLARRPYLDSLRPLADALAAPAMAGVQAGVSVAMGDGTPHRWMGLPMAHLADFQGAYPADLGYAWAGFDFPVYMTPTNPYMRDRNGNAITTGRLTLGRVLVAVAETGGMSVTVDTSSGSSTAVTFRGHRIGFNDLPIGTQPIVTAEIGAAIGREIRECRYTLWGMAWLPFTVTAIGWSGQSFNNARRVS